MEARYLTDLEWRICHAVNIYVFRNGKDGEQPILVHIPPAKKKNMKTLMNVIQDRVKYPVGYAKFLFKMDGTRIRDPCELEMYNNYVVASNFEKHFKCAAYGRKRSPLLVLNRESKHVRVLKLQNQNYYEWLLKKKAVGEERPPYIYPTYYTSENKWPQDLPVGQMGNYHPEEVQAPGCCYPKIENPKTFRMEGGGHGHGHGHYVANSVTVDVTPDLSNKTQLPTQNSKQNSQNKRSKKNIFEQTPSDILNANTFVSDGTSQEAVSLSVASSEAEENKLKNSSSNKDGQRKSKSNRVRGKPTNPEDHQKGNSLLDLETSNPSMEEFKRSKKSTRKSKKNKEGEFGGLPPPPSQFRDLDVGGLSAKNPQPQPGTINQNNQEMFNFVRSARDQNGNIVPLQPTIQHPTSFYYSPEKLAEINPAGNIQPFELGVVQQPQQQQPNPGTGQWAVIHQPQPQQIFTLEPQPQPQPQRFYPTQTVDANNNPTYTSQYQGVVGPFPTVQSFPMQQHPPPPTNMQQMQSTQGIPMLLQTSPGGQPTQCVVIPTPNSTQNPIQPTQLVTLQNPNNQSHIQHVYRLGIVQQPNPQQCIQIDAKAMRQYVDNQKLIESRFGGAQYSMQPQNGDQGQGSQGKYHQANKRDGESQSDQTQTESEIDIPFTPMKTYRLHATNSTVSDSKLSRSSRRVLDGRLPKVKSRNVAIQMGYPGASPSPRFEIPHRGNVSETSMFHEGYRNNPFRSPGFRGGGHLMSSRNCRPNDTGPPMNGMETYFIANSVNARCSSRNFNPTYSDHYTNMQSSRGPFVQKTNVSVRSAKRKLQSDPVIEELVSIPPPSEFRESMRCPDRHRNPQQNSFNCNNNNSPPTNNFYHPYCNDNDRFKSQYNYNNYSH